MNYLSTFTGTAKSTIMNKRKFKDKVYGELAKITKSMANPPPELPKKTESVSYCRGPFCVYADEAIAMLAQAGYKAKRLAEGFPDWKVKELPIEFEGIKVASIQIAPD